MVGEEGRVIAADIHKEMLDMVGAGAQRLGLRQRIVLHQCRGDSLGIAESADFVLAFWVAHEVPDLQRFFAEVVTMLKPQGLFLLVEPKLHTHGWMFRHETEQAAAAGLKPCREVKVSLSRAMLFSL
jgi:ubiquinone/menaquinone biosynthesis C-methylase UbiE